MFRQLLVNKHPRLRDPKSRSRFGRVEVWVWLPTKKKTTKKNKSRAEQEPRSAHGRAVNNKNNKSRAKQEPRSAHGRAVKKKNKKRNKSRAEQEPPSAHGRAVNNKSRVKQEPRSAHGRAVNKFRAEQEPRSAHGRAVNKLYSIYTTDSTNTTLLCSTNTTPTPRLDSTNTALLQHHKSLHQHNSTQPTQLHFNLISFTPSTQLTPPTQLYSSLHQHNLISSKV